MPGTRLQRKTLGVIGLTFVALVVVLYIASRAIVLGSFSEQEDIEAKQNVKRVVGALDESLRTLEGTTRDWALWDDTYNYVKDHNQTYYDTNLSTISTMMSNNHLNLVVFMDSSDQVVFQKVFDYNTFSDLPVPNDLGKHLYPGGTLLGHINADSSIKGLIFLAQAPMLLASEPIMRGNSQGDVAGTLIFGRFLDPEAIEHLSQVTLLGITFTTVEDGVALKQYGDLIQTPGRTRDVTLQKLSDTTMSGLLMIDDVYGNPSLIVEVRMSREIYQRGEQTFSYYILTLIGVGVIFTVVIMAALGKLVLYRLARLRADVRKIGDTTDMSVRVNVAGNDELSDVADSINEMMCALQRAREEQRESEERYKAVVEQTNEAILLAEASTGRFIEANAAAQVLLGYDRRELLDLTISAIAQSSELDSGKLVASGTTGRLRLSTEKKYKRKNGHVVHVEVSEIGIMYGGKQVLCIVARDITERKRSEELLHELAMRDGLTGLYNRREMHRILREQVERHKRHNIQSSLILMDIDYFKSINDTYGHQVGDEVIRWISAVAQDLVRTGDKVARYGGEEIAIVLPETDSNTAFKVAERIRQAIAHKPFQHIRYADEGSSELLIPITVSLGIATLPQDCNSEEGMIKAADTALYAAKHNGRNRTIRYEMLEHEALVPVGTA